jgi:hypothetical protein
MHTKGDIRTLGTSIKSNTQYLNMTHIDWQERLNYAKQAKGLLEIYIASIASAYQEKETRCTRK